MNGDRRVDVVEFQGRGGLLDHGSNVRAVRDAWPERCPGHQLLDIRFAAGGA